MPVIHSPHSFICSFIPFIQCNLRCQLGAPYFLRYRWDLFEHPPPMLYEKVQRSPMGFHQIQRELKVFWTPQYPGHQLPSMLPWVCPHTTYPWVLGTLWWFGLGYLFLHSPPSSSLGVKRIPLTDFYIAVEYTHLWLKLDLHPKILP